METRELAGNAPPRSTRKTRGSTRISALISRFEEAGDGQVDREGGSAGRAGRTNARENRSAGSARVQPDGDTALPKSTSSVSTSGATSVSTSALDPRAKSEASRVPLFSDPMRRPGRASGSYRDRWNSSDPFDDRFAALSPTLASQDSLLAELLAADARELAVDGPSADPAISTAPSPVTIPLHRVFARDAEPLVLPGLDDAIRALGGPASFSPMPTRSGLPSERFRGSIGRASLESTTASCVKGVGAAPEDEAEAEQRGWEAWVRDGPPRSRWSSFTAAVRRRVPGLAARATTSDRATGTDLSPEQHHRSLIFPPFHQLPPGVTVTDLKQNRRRSQPLLTLQSALGIVGNAILGAAGSNKGISLTTIEGIRDLMQ